MSQPPTPAAPSIPLPTSPESPEQTDQTPELQNLITELRASLNTSETLLKTQGTRLAHLTDVETELAEIKDKHAFLTASKDALEKRIQEEISRREQAEETVELLRGQVERARQGVGMLQKQDKERKRLSQLPLPTSLGMIGGESEEVMSEKEQKTARRQSLMMGPRTHRRASSHSDQDPTALQAVKSSYTSPNPADNPAKSGGLRELRLGTSSMASGPTSASATSPIGGFFDDPSHPAPPSQRTPSGSSAVIHSSPPKVPSVAEEEAAKLRTELDMVRSQLLESEESRQASEAVLKALREFMASGGEGAPPSDDMLKELRLPPLPTDKDNDQEDGKLRKVSGQSAGGWTFNKLWRGAGNQGPISPPMSTVVEPPGTPGQKMSPPPSIFSSNTPRVSPHPTPGELPIDGAVQNVPVSQTPLSSFVSGWTKGVVPGTPAERPGQGAGGRKLTSFFSRGAKKEEKDLPSQPEEESQGLTVAEGANGENAGLEPSPSIAETGTASEEVVYTTGEETDTADPSDPRLSRHNESGEE